MKCLEQIIGITREPCDALITVEPGEDYTTSKSGMYMDELEGSVSLQAIKNNVGACQSLYSVLTSARDQAVRRVADDLVIEINSQYKRDKTNFVGEIGQLNFTASLSTARPFVGHYWQGYPSVDGMIRVKAIKLVVDGVMDTELKLYRKNRTAGSDGVMEEILVLPVTTSAGINNVPIPSDSIIKLPLVIYGDQYDYYWSYELKNGVEPKNNKAICSTCTSFAPLKKFFTPQGVEYNADGDMPAITNTQSYGLWFSLDVRCDNESFVCREYDNDNDIAYILAYAVRFKANEIAIANILSSDNVNRYTMQNREYLAMMKNNFRNEYEKRVRWLSLNIDTSSSDCFVCRGADMAFGGILI